MGWALVTGASSGMGAEFCRQLARRGYSIIMVSRRTNLMEKVRAEIIGQFPVQCVIMPADLSKADDIERVCQRLRSEEEPVDLLVSNAGYATGQIFPEADLSVELDNMRVMVEAPMRLAHAAVATMGERGYGGIIFLGSFASSKTLGMYSVHKTWLKVFSENLRLDVKKKGLKVVYIAPGTVRTAFWENFGAYRQTRFYRLCALSPAHVVRCSLFNYRFNRPIVIVGVLYKFLNQVERLLPRALVNRIAYWINASRMHM